MQNVPVDNPTPINIIKIYLGGKMPVSVKKASSKRAVNRQSTLSKWGNSLGVRIPQEAVDQLKLTAGAEVNVRLSGDSLTITPVRKQ